MKVSYKTFFLALQFMMLCSPSICRGNRTILPLEELHRGKISNQRDRIFFYTQPRSGTHWTFYLMQFFSKRPISVGEEFCDFFGLEYNLEKPYIHHIHGVNFLNPPFVLPNPKNDKLLITLRDPKEVFFRNIFSYESAKNQLTQHGLEILYSILGVYDTWPEKSKMIIYYEDLLEHPKETILRLLEFIEEPVDNLEDFFDHFSEHQERCLSYYDKYHYSYSKGKNSQFHQNKLSKKEVLDLQKHIKQFNPTLWERYLGRYEL